MRSANEIRLKIAAYTGKIERLRRKIATGRYTHAILRYKEGDVARLKIERRLLEWTLE